MYQKKGLTRNCIDKYYTVKSTVDLCIDAFLRHIKLSKNDIIIEPSAGNGAFIDNIKNITNENKSNNNSCIFIDIAPDHPDILNQDFLETNFDVNHDFSLSAESRKIHVIGNPPFGRQSTMAIKFIKKAASISHSISYILPKSFKKDSLKKAFPPYFHMEYEIDLPDYSFLVNNVKHDVPCVFQIWVKKEIKRPIKDVSISKHFSFVKKTELPVISFRRVGVNAGDVSFSILDKSDQSHYFIKFNKDISHSMIQKYVNTLINLEFDTNNTVGPKSISKQELIDKFNAAVILIP